MLNVRSRARIFSLMVLLFITLLTASPAQAYQSLPSGSLYPKLPGSAASLYIYYDHLNSVLGISNSGTHSVHALNQWSIAAEYVLFDILVSGYSLPASSTVRATNFSSGYSTTCANLNTLPAGTPGFACPVDRNVFLNSHIDFKWNTSGTQGSYIYDSVCLCTRRNTDYLTVFLHELGHLWSLGHPNLGSLVMKPDWTAKQTLAEDDKRGATQYYAPNTGWETSLTLSWFPGYTYSQAQGTNVLLYQTNTTSPSIQATSSELGVTPYSGTRYLRLTGSATSASGAYAYMKVFQASDEEFGNTTNHFVITSGTYISWYQYNHTQSRMSVDIIFSDGTALRNYGILDQNGINVHPTARGSYPIGSWFFVQANLGSLAGKKIKDIVIAYDNGSSGGSSGTFRSYFDNLEISY